MAKKNLPAPRPPFEETEEGAQGAQTTQNTQTAQGALPQGNGEKMTIYEYEQRYAKRQNARSARFVS